MSPAAKPKVKKQDSDFSFLTLAGVDALLCAVADDYLGQTDRTLILTAAYTGLRQGELPALRWRDVLWTRSKLQVRASVARGVEGDPKSTTSKRDVAMPDRVARALELHHQASAYKTDDDRVFAHPQTGRAYDASKLRDRFYEAMTAAGFEHMMRRDGGGIVFHSLRHTFGTTMASAGVPIVAINGGDGPRRHPDDDDLRQVGDGRRAGPQHREQRLWRQRLSESPGRALASSVTPWYTVRVSSHRPTQRIKMKSNRGYRTMKLSRKNDEPVAVYASEKVAQALETISADMDLHDGVRLGEVLEAAYNQGSKDGARNAFDQAEELGLDEARKQIKHRNPGRPRKEL